MAIVLHYNKTRDYFWADAARGSYKQEGTDASILKSVGFKSAYPDNIYAKRLGVPEWKWYTTDIEPAIKMKNFADAEALVQIEEYEKQLENAELEIDYQESGDPSLSYFYASKFAKIHEKVLKSVWYHKEDACGKGNYGFMYSGSAAEQERMPVYMQKFIKKYNVPEKTWWTPNIFVAKMLGKYAVNMAADIIAAHNEVVKESSANTSDLELPTPPGVNAKNYQRAGVKWALDRDGVLIADEQGLGKTFQAIAITNIDTSIKDVLVICPSAVKINWAREFEKFATRNCQTVVVDRVADIPKRKPNCMRVMIINFDKFSGAKERALLTKAFMDMRVDMIIIDEAHNLKNPKAKRTRAILGWQELEEPFTFHDGIATVAKKRVYLTGTPIKNRPIELWSLVSTLAPNVFNNYINYAYRYCCAEKTRFGFDVKGSSHLPELEDLLRSTIMIRRLKNDVLSELPAKTRQILFLEPDKETQKLLDEEKKRLSSGGQQLISLLEKAEVTNNNADFIAAANIMQDKKVDFTEIADLRHKIGRTKIKAAVEHIKNTIDSMSNGVDKVIVFAHHHDVIEGLEYQLTHEEQRQGKGGKKVIVETDKYKPVVYMGGMGSGKKADEKKQAIIDQFQNDKSVKVFIGSSAAYTGITLTAANVVIFVELQFVPSEMLQGEDRAHRIGQRKNVLVQHLVYANSIDAKISKMFVDKMDVITSALDLYSKLGIPAKDIPKGGIDPDEIVKKVEVAGIQATATIDVAADELGEKTKIEDEDIVKPSKTKTVAVKTYTDEQKNVAYNSIQYLYSVCDGAQTKDGMGFSVKTLHDGNVLASLDEFSDYDMEIAMPVLNWHRRQLNKYARDVLGLWPKGEKPLFTTKQKKVLLSTILWMKKNVTDLLDEADAQIVKEEIKGVEGPDDISDKLADVFKRVINDNWQLVDDKYKALITSMKLKRGRGRPKRVEGSDESVKLPERKPRKPTYYPRHDMGRVKIEDIEWIDVGESLPNINNNPKLSATIYQPEFSEPVIRKFVLSFQRNGERVTSEDYLIMRQPVPEQANFTFQGSDGVYYYGNSPGDIYGAVNNWAEALQEKKRAAKTRTTVSKPTPKPKSGGKYTNSQRKTARESITYLDEYFNVLKEENTPTPYTDEWISNIKLLNRSLPEYPTDVQMQQVIKILKAHRAIFKPMGVFDKLNIKLRTLKK